MSSTQLPLTISAAAFDPTFNGTLAEAIDQAFANARIVTQEVFALFLTGSVEPTSNVGPWAKNSNTWMAWSDTLGRYDPFLIPQERLKYVVQADTGTNDDDPDHDVFDVWIVIDEDGNTIDVRTWNETETDWKGLSEEGFYSKNQIDAFFGPTVDGKKTVAWENITGNPTGVSFRANKNATQTEATPFEEVLLFENVAFNGGSGYSEATGRFTAPVKGVYNVGASVSMGGASGTPTDIDINLRLTQDGVAIIAVVTNESPTETRRRVYHVATDIALEAGQFVEVVLFISATGASTWDLNGSGSDLNTQFYGHLVHTT